MFRTITAIVFTSIPAIVFAHEGHGAAPALSVAHTMLDHGAVLAIAMIVGIAYTTISNRRKEHAQ